jgi:hypothetical protein
MSGRGLAYGRRAPPRTHVAAPANTPAPTSRGGPCPSVSRAYVCPCGVCISIYVRTVFSCLPLTPLHTHEHAREPRSSRRLRQMGPTATCVTLDLLLQHLDETITTYVLTVKTLATYV